MKKIFTFIALLTFFLGAKAEWVEKYTIDYSQLSGFPFYVMGYVPEFYDGVMTDLGSYYNYAPVEGASEISDVIVKTQGGTEYYRYELSSPKWHQYFLADGIPTEIDGTYKVVAQVRASEDCTFNVNMGWGWDEGQSISKQISVTTEWKEVALDYTGIGGTSCNLVAQPGGLTAKIEWHHVVVFREKVNEEPDLWVEALENGDAEKSWESLGLADVKWYDGENNYKVCAWSKEQGVNDSQPKPCDIEEEADGNHVFVVHSRPAAEGEGSPWDNQFWIQSPKAWKAGTQLKIHFRYKASVPVSSTGTQIHEQNPSAYHWWDAIGPIAFTTEWKVYDETITFTDGMAGGWSIAFNLNSVVKDAVDFYFDDLSWQYMNIDQGYFVAGINTANETGYDLDNAIEFAYDEDEGVWSATVGEEDAFVNQVMISSFRGNDTAFKTATLKPSAAITLEPDVWVKYTTSPLATINLPRKAIWKISIKESDKTMSFVVLKDNSIEINPNPTEIVINAQERDYTSAEQEGGTGQPWDNQMWIVANRELKAGESTVIQFKYKSAIPAKVSTQCHKTPGAYLYWDAIGDVNFTEEWKEFEKTYVVPSGADGMMSIAFNMAEIKDANTYEIKDVVWKLEDETESLINQTGSDNFFMKVGGGMIHVYDPNADNLLGDVNGDRAVSIADVTMTVAYVCGNKQNGFIKSNADVNGDNDINISDVMAIVGIVIGN